MPPARRGLPRPPRNRGREPDRVNNVRRIKYERVNVNTRTGGSGGDRHTRVPVRAEWVRAGCRAGRGRQPAVQASTDRRP
jgi:hypothetical protein